MSRRDPARPLRAWRWPALVVIPVLLVAGVVVERGLDDDADAPAATAVATLTPTAAAPGAPGSTWYCAGGTATGTDEGVAEHVVHVANAGDTSATGVLTAFPSEGEPVATDIEVPAHGRLVVRLADLVTAPYAAALVEVGGGEVAVQHEVAGSFGRSVGACASAPATAWYFPAGTTRPGTRLVLAVFNPFPQEAVVDLRFDTDDGTRTPQAYQGLVVPGGGVLPLEVTEVVTLRQEVATEVLVRSGRVVVDQLQVGEGREDAPAGLAVTLGAPAAAATWLFPDGIGAEGYAEQVVLFNPDTIPAEVDVQVLLDDPEVHGVAEPFEVTVGPGRFAVVDIFGDGRVPVGVAHAIVVRSRNDVAVVAERVVIGGEDAPQPGIAYTMGAPVVADRWIVPVASLPGSSAVALVLLNPSSTEPVRVAVQGFGDGRLGAAGGLADVEIPPGGRLILDLGTDAQGFDALAVDVRAEGPVVVEARFGFEEGDDITYLVAVPVAGSVDLPAGTVGELGTEDLLLDGG